MTHVEGWEILAVLLGAVWAGAINAVVGSGTLVTFPVLLAAGLPPVTATMSNAIGLVPGNAAAAWGYRAELRGQGGRIARFLPASVVGALGGAWLLLHLPEGAFETIVPVLLILAVVLVVFQKRLQRIRGGRTEDPRGVTGLLVVGGVLLTGVYGGYFSAAQGIILVAMLGVVTAETLQRLNGLKNLLVLAVNLVAGAAYAAVGHDRIDWFAVVLVSAGSVLGGILGARYGRRLPAAVLRGCIVVLGCVAIAVILAR